MGWNNSPPLRDSEGRLFVKNPHPVLVGLMSCISATAAFVAAPLIYFDTGCDIEYSPQVSGHGKWLFTLVLGLATAFGGGLGGWAFNAQHRGAYKHMGWYPPVYTIFFLLFIVEFGLFAVPFLHADSSQPAIGCMKKIIWTSVVGVVAWALIAFVSFIDWRKYGNVLELAKQLREEHEGAYESPDANYPMDDYMGGHHDAHHGGYHYQV